MIISVPYEDEARRWLALRISGEMTDGQRAEFRTWLRQSGDHQHAYSQVERLWSDLDWDETLNLEALNGAAEKTHAPASYVSWRTPVLSAVGGLMAACIAVVAFVAYPPRAVVPVTVPAEPAISERIYQTSIGEVDTFTLEDGSEVTLAGNSRLAVLQMDDRRVVELLEGDSYFKVTRDEQRPFTVRAPQLTVTVLGTQFEVNSKPDHDEVSVAEGRVEVATQDQAGKVQLTVGERARVDRDGIATAQFDPSRIAGWRDGRLSFVNAPLEELVAEANRYYPGGVYFGSKDVSGLKVTTSFRTDQTEAAISGVARSLGLVVVRTETGALVLIQPPSTSGK